MFIEKLKTIYQEGKPIFTEDIISLFPEFTKAYIYRMIKKAIDNNELSYYSRGVYCLPKKTFFGYSTITSKDVADNKYVTNGSEVYGVYSGLTLLNQFAITSQVPNTLEIVTNNEATRKRMIDIDGMKYIIRKSRFEITKQNYNYYKILQLFLELGTNATLDNFAKSTLSRYLIDNNIKIEILIKYAMYFPAQTLKNLMGSGVINGTI